MLSSVARMFRFRPHLARGDVVLSFFGGRGRHPRGHADEQDDHWPSDHRISEWCSGVHDLKRKQSSDAAPSSSTTSMRTRRCRFLESILGQTLDARQPHVVANPPDVVEVQDIAGRIA